VIRAPFSGTVTRIVAEVGSSVGVGGVLRLVETTRPEIEVDVDETNLSRLRVGQRAAVTSPTFRGERFDATVTELSPSVDPTRGTVQVTLVPQQAPAWLRPGQTVNVEIITQAAVERLTLPRSAVRRSGGRSVVLVARDGRAVAQPVVTGDAVGDTLPVLEGITAADRVIRNAEAIEVGARVRVTGGGGR
jgi:HlyD family secretion protein